MNTIILSQNSIKERDFVAMLGLSEQGFRCVCSYKDKIGLDNRGWCNFT